MKWLDPRAVLFTLLVAWLLIFSAYLLIVQILVTLARYWYVALVLGAVFIGIWVAMKLIRRRLDRW